MTELLTSAQMRAIEQAAIASGAVTGLELMERAGAGVVAAVLEEWPGLALSSHRAFVLCGPGNNGGDGFVVARLLSERGWEVELFLYGDPGKLPPDARMNFQRWRTMGAVAPLVGSKDSLRNTDLSVDALFGTGLVRPMEGEVAELVTAMREMSPRGHHVSVDAPSGLCLDSGRVLGTALRAQLTVTFHAAKTGHFLAEAPAHVGKLVVHDIGLSPSDRHSLEASLTHERLALPVAKRTGHKFAHGHALILSGPASRTGAARLAARGALRIGAGLVTVAAPAEAMAEHAARLDAIMLREVSGADDLAAMLTDERITALCLGPGLGLDDRAAELVSAALGRVGNLPTTREGGQIAHPTRPIILDADALTLLSRHSHLFASLHENCVLTPHAGEFARLFPDIAEKLAAPATKGPAYSKVDATREAAARAGCVVLYKGPDTVIADPSGRTSINSAAYERAAPWLATAGSGDVLAGFIAGLLARGFAPMLAAETAAWLHVECARSFGPGLIAEDLPEKLPDVLRALGL
jgi:hydroxyethylthiazole kinase-like uncharacterized protein yjeF